MAVSARNQLKGKITDIVLGTVMAHVTIKVGENVIESVRTIPPQATPRLLNCQLQQALLLCAEYLDRDASRGTGENGV